MTTGEVRMAGAYCLFHCGVGYLAVDVNSVEVVVEVHRLVRLPLCPRPVSALGIYRGGVLPIVEPIDDSSRVGAASAGQQPSVLVLRTGHGPLGLLIDRGSLAVVEDCRVAASGAVGAERGEASALPGGLVAAGSIERDGSPHAILDVGRTWAALRGLVESGYGAYRGVPVVGTSEGRGRA
jgi:hypothetical protein